MLNFSVRFNFCFCLDQRNLKKSNFFMKFRLIERWLFFDSLFYYASTILEISFVLKRVLCKNTIAIHNYTPIHQLCIQLFPHYRKINEFFKWFLQISDIFSDKFGNICFRHNVTMDTNVTYKVYFFLIFFGGQY